MQSLVRCSYLHKKLGRISISVGSYICPNFYSWKLWWQHFQNFWSSCFFSLNNLQLFLTTSQSKFGNYKTEDSTCFNDLMLYYVDVSRTGLLWKLNETYLRTSCFRSSPAEVFIGKGVLKICSKFTGKHPCWNVVSVKSLCSFIEITRRHGRFPVNLLHILKNNFL